MEQNHETQEVVLETKANTLLLLVVLGIISALMLYSIYLTASVFSEFTDVGLVSAMWKSASGGGAIIHGITLVIMVCIGLMHFVNKIIGEKSQLISRVISKLLKLPVGILLVMISLWLGFLGYGKFETGVTDANLNGGGYILEWINVASILYLTFFVKKI